MMVWRAFLLVVVVVLPVELVVLVVLVLRGVGSLHQQLPGLQQMAVANKRSPD